MSNKTFRTAMRGAAALAVTALVSLGLATPGSAAPAPGNIDPDASVSLTVHKYVQPDGTLGDNDGHEITNVPTDAEALSGVEFTIQRVTSVDLLTNAGWDALEDLTAADVIADPATYPLGAAVSHTTNGDGVATFTSAETQIGLYLVQETNPGTNPIVAPAIPFLVTLPQADGAGEWNYNVHVYPKNAISEVTKSVDDSDAVVLGDDVEWTISSAVPRLPEGTNYTDYAISDDLDTRLGFTSATVSLVDGATTTPLVENTHYTLSAPAVGANGEVVVSFSAPGLALLNAAGASATVDVVLTTEVLALGDGVITNEATVFINDPQRENGQDSNEVDTKWGALRIVKYATGDQSNTLEGAKFDVYAVDPAVNTNATPVYSGLTTDETGAASLVLQTGQATTRNYWIVETQAPAGYELNSTPIQVEIVAGSMADADIVGIANQQNSPFRLPLTGAGGTTMMLVIGMGLLGIGGGALALNRKRNRTEESARA